MYDAMNFAWAQRDLTSYLKFQSLSPWEKVGRLVADGVVYAFSCLVGAKLYGSKVPEEKQKEYDGFILNKSVSSVKNQSVILVLIGDNDLITSKETFEQVENQSESTMVFVRVSSLEDASKAINTLKKSSCQIQALWIRAHGTPDSINFMEGSSGLSISPNGPYAVDETNKFLETLDEKLEKEAPIILESCHTGSVVAEGENIATAIARIARRKTYAPSREARAIEKGVSYSKGSGFKVVIEGDKSSKSFKKGSFCSRIMAIWHHCMNRREDITCEFLPAEG